MKGVSPVMYQTINGKKLVIDKDKVRKGQYPLSRYLYLVSVGKY